MKEFYKPAAVVTAEGDAPPKDYSRSDIQEIVVAGLEARRSAEMLTNLLAAVVLQRGGTVVVEAEELDERLSSVTLHSEQDPISKRVTLTAEKK